MKSWRLRSNLQAPNCLSEVCKYLFLESGESAQEAKQDDENAAQRAQPHWQAEYRQTVRSGTIAPGTNAQLPQRARCSHHERTTLNAACVLSVGVGMSVDPKRR